MRAQFAGTSGVAQPIRRQSIPGRSDEAGGRGRARGSRVGPVAPRIMSSPGPASDQSPLGARLPRHVAGEKPACFDFTPISIYYGDIPGSIKQLFQSDSIFRQAPSCSLRQGGPNLGSRKLLAMCSASNRRPSRPREPNRPAQRPRGTILDAPRAWEGWPRAGFWTPQTALPAPIQGARASVRAVSEDLGPDVRRESIARPPLVCAGPEDLGPDPSLSTCPPRPRGNCQLCPHLAVIIRVP
jgi:hypothetical protein